MPSTPPISSTVEGSLSVELIQRIEAGDRAAWEDLYLRYRDRLLLSIRCRLGASLRARVESEDVLHSVFKDALLGFDGLDHRGAGSLDRYLHACVLNKIRNKADFFGAKKRAGETPLTDSLVRALPAPRGGDLGYVDAERYERLERVLGHLPEEMREVVLLRRIEGLSNQEAATVVGKSPEATSKLYNRALARLGQSLKQSSP